MFFTSRSLSYFHQRRIITTLLLQWGSKRISNGITRRLLVSRERYVKDRDRWTPWFILFEARLQGGRRARGTCVNCHECNEPCLQDSCISLTRLIAVNSYHVCCTGMRHIQVHEKNYTCWFQQFFFSPQKKRRSTRYVSEQGLEGVLTTHVARQLSSYSGKNDCCFCRFGVEVGTTRVGRFWLWSTCGGTDSVKVDEW
jgi:hypothetical protein